MHGHNTKYARMRDILPVNQDLVNKGQPMHS
jgi:hypothetical protein